MPLDPRRKRASAPTPAAPIATAATPAIRTHAVRFFMVSDPSARRLQVVGAAPRVGQEDAPRELLRQALVGSTGLLRAVGLLERRGEAHEDVVARHGQGSIVGQGPVRGHGLVGLFASAIQVRQRAASRSAAPRRRTRPRPSGTSPPGSRTAAPPASPRPAAPPRPRGRGRCRTRRRKPSRRTPYAGPGRSCTPTLPP